MSTATKASKSWIARKKWHFIIGLPLFSFLFLGPIPVGLVFYYPIRDKLRGHPQGHHGTQPPQFVGLWVRDKVEEFDFIGQAFYLMPNGRFGQMTGMTERRWHFDKNRFFVDAVSRCGNCYQGNITSEFTAKFLSPDQLVITKDNKESEREIGGIYRRLQVTDKLKAEMNKLAMSDDDSESFKARMVLEAIKFSESYSKPSIL